MRLSTNVMRRWLLAAAVSAIALASCSMGSVATTRHALVYGVSLYNPSYAEGDSGVDNLTYSDDDAVSMASALSSDGWSNDVRLRSIGTGTGHTTTTEPTKASLFAEIDDLASAIGASDTVLVYFSGHGTRAADGTVYFIPYRALTYTTTVNGISIDIDYSKCVSPADLDAELAKLPTNKVIVILDTCYSGGFVNAGADLDTAPQNYGVLDDGTAGSTVLAALGNFGALLSANAAARSATPPLVLSAAGSAEYSWESNGHGLFTYFLLQAAGSGDANGDGYVTATEAYSYAESGIKSEWNSKYYAYYDQGLYADFMPHITGGARDLVLFSP